jgi:hypothetical protein
MTNEPMQQEEFRPWHPHSAAVIQRLGRNVLLFQLVEGYLKLLVPYAHEDGASKSDAAFAQLRKWISDKSLGHVLEKFKPLGHQTEIDARVFDDYVAQVLDARNKMTHGLVSVPGFSLLTEDGCRVAIDLLDGHLKLLDPLLNWRRATSPYWAMRLARSMMTLPAQSLRQWAASSKLLKLTRRNLPSSKAISIRDCTDVSTGGFGGRTCRPHRERSRRRHCDTACRCEGAPPNPTGRHRRAGSHTALCHDRQAAHSWISPAASRRPPIATRPTSQGRDICKVLINGYENGHRTDTPRSRVAFQAIRA